MSSYTNDSISDFLARVKNAYAARHKSLEVPFVRTLSEIGKILEKEKFVKEVKVVTESKRKKLLITLDYPHRKSAITDVKRISKPGLRVYTSKNNIPRVLGGFGAVIISTPEGIMTGKEAKKRNLGGEIMCKVW